MKNQTQVTEADNSPDRSRTERGSTELNITERPRTAAARLLDHSMTAAERDALPANKFAVPAKRQLPIHDKKHAKLAWDLLKTTKDLTPDEKKTARRRILLALKKFGVDTSKYKTGAMSDAGRPENVSDDEFRQALSEELAEAYRHLCLTDVYSADGYILAYHSDRCPACLRWCEESTCIWCGVPYGVCVICQDGNDAEGRFKIPFTITGMDDDDGDIDLVNVEFGEPVEVRMVPAEFAPPAVVTDRSGAAAASGEAVRSPSSAMLDSIPVGETILDDFVPVSARILSDDSERTANNPLRFRLPGPVANVVNSNNRLYPRQVLSDAMDRARKEAKAGRMVAYAPHPEPYTAPDGSYRFKTRLEDRVAIVQDCFMDDAGTTWWDYQVIRTQKGRDLEASVMSGAPIGTSVRAIGDVAESQYGGRRINVARSMDIISNDFVENPALDTAMAKPALLTDEAVNLIIASAKSERVSASASNPGATSAEGQDAGKSDLEDQGKMIDKNSERTEPAASATAGEQARGAAAGANRAADGSTAKGEPVLDATTQKRLAMLDDPRFQALLDEHSEKERSGKVKTFLDDAVGGKPVKLGPNSKAELLDLSRFSEKQIAAIVDSCKDADPETVGKRLEMAINMADSFNAEAKLEGIGYRSNGGGKGKTVDNGGVQIFVDAPHAYKEHVDKLCVAMDDAMQRVNGAPMIDPALRKANQAFIDKVIGGYMRREDQARAMSDSAQHFLTDDASLSTLLQQPTITPATAALIQQVYWLVSWLPMCGGIGPDGFNAGPGNDLGIGENLRVPVQTRGSGRAPFGKLENAALTQVNTLLRWLNFAPSWRGIGFRMTKEAEVQLAKGSARYDVLGRQLAAIASIIGENVDIDIAHEHISASDEYLSVQVGTLSGNTWTGGEVHVNADVITNGATLSGMGYNQVSPGGSQNFVGANEQAVASAVKIAQTFTVGSNTYQRPIVPTRHVRVVQEDGTISTTTDTFSNPINATVGGGPALIRGLLNENGNIIDDPTGTSGAQYAVDYENGVFVFASFATSGVDGTHPPTIGYAYATNFDVFDVSGSASAQDVHLFYDGLLGQIRVTAAQMGSAPRFSAPDMCISDLNAAAFIQDARSALNLFTAKGVDVSVSEPMPAEYGMMGKISIGSVNTPWRVGSGRILLGRRRATKYAVQYPFTVEGPIPDYVLVSNKPTPTGNKNWTAQENSLICTPVAFDVVNSATVFRNHPFRTIKIVGQASAVY